METKIVVPSLGESVVEATVARWLKKEGDRVEAGEPLVELETDKVNLEVGAERAGVLSHIERAEGQDVKIGDVLGTLVEGDGASPQKQSTPPVAATGAAEKPAPPAEKPPSVPQTAPPREEPASKMKATPSARRLAQERGVDLAKISGTGSGNQVTRTDLEAFIQKKAQPVTEKRPASPPQLPELETRDREERVRMTRRRRTIARRLVEAQHAAAMLTTYNEIDMTLVMDLRKRQKESFKQKYGVNLGIVSFFAKAAIGALKAFPALNAEIQEDEIVYKYYYDIGVAIGAEEGLVVPVLRNADRMSFAEIEKGIKQFVEKSEAGELSLEDLRGGTFTITNGGVFGSLLSTPILNPPQVAILGLHKIEERPVVMNGEVRIRPMMYVALSYDHRIVDGRESVQFLAKIKQLVEDPSALLLES